MIIPIRCMNCGKVLADKWRFYQEQLRAMKGADAEQRVYFDGSRMAETAEKKLLDAMNIRRPCCRKHFITQVDLIDKI